MSGISDKYLSGLELEGPASPDAIAGAVQALGVELPHDYLEFIKQHNGAEGFVGDHSYLQLWPVQTIAPRNAAYCVARFAPGLIIIGANGGEMAYAYDTRDPAMPIIEVPFIPMELEQVSHCAGDLGFFLKYLYHIK